MVGDGLLLDVVELVHALLPRHKLADGSADHYVAYVIIATTWTPLLRRNHLLRSTSERQERQKGGEKRDEEMRDAWEDYIGWLLLFSTAHGMD